MWDTLWINANLATMAAGKPPYGAVAKGALGVKGGKIAWAGAEKDLPEKPGKLSNNVVDCLGRLVTPALIDCHTHLIFAGDRAGEFEQRLQGVSYEEIAKKGGGILATVKATRAAGDDELAVLGMERARAMMSEGVGVIEVKSGYGLDKETEIKILAAATAVGEALPVRIVRTFLGAHALPPEFKNDRKGYLDLLINGVLPVLKKENLADAVDAYLEGIAFTADEVSALFDAAKKLGFPVKLHADQLSDTGGAALAAQYGALSADHLEYANEAGVKAMAKAGTAAVLLPGAFYVLREKQLPPVDLFRKHKVSIAIATDCNPGTSPVLSLRLMMNMACTLFGLTPEEALAGVTRNAARALGLGDETGTLEEGKAASFAIWDAASPAALSYEIGGNPLEGLVLEGEPVIMPA